MDKLHELALGCSSAIANLAMWLASYSASVTCTFTAYQPKMPEQLKR